MKIGIIGMGHVGTTLHALLDTHAQLVTYDAAHDDKYPHDELAECDFAIVCVNTPPGPAGECDLTHVRDAITRLPTTKVMIKSTVAPGTTDALIADTGKQICFSPEYVGQSTYINPLCDDAATMPFLVLGGQPSIRRYFIETLQPMLGPTKVYFQCGAAEAEVIKYMENTFFATKITFVNEFWQICRAVGADWHTVREGWLLDPRVESSHTAVFTTDRGFGGKCLPKDTAAIIAAARLAGYEPHLLAAVLASNTRFRAPAA